MFMSCAKRTGERFGSAHLIDVLRGSRGERVLGWRHDRISTYGIGRDRSKEEWQHLARELLRGGYIRQEPEEYNAVKVTDRGHAVLLRGQKVFLAAAPAPRAASASGGADAAADATLFEELRALRKRLADERRVPPYVIFHDSVLREMATRFPRRRAELLAIPGVGERKASDFGDEFLSCVARHAPANGDRPIAMPAPRRARRQPGELSDTVRTTLALFNAGQGLAEIAATRQLAVRTIEEHLAEAVEAGEAIELDRLVDAAKRAAIEAVIQEVGDDRLKPIMERLGEGFTYGEIRLVKAARALT
jgi:ATP-dependent DNA helicase RecQ